MKGEATPPAPFPEAARLLVRLRAAGRRRSAIEAGRLLAGAVAWAVALALGLALLDAAMPLPAWLRAAGAAYAALLPVFAAGRAAVAARRTRPEAVAQAFERAHPSLDGHLLNAVGLATAPEAPGAPAFKRREIALAAGLLASCRDAVAYPARPLGRAALRAGAALALAAGMGLLAPGLAARQAARLCDPFGDHPPLALIGLAWIEPAEPVVRFREGEAVRLVVAVRGPARAAPVLLEEEAGAARRAAPFWAAGEGRFALRLGPLRRSRTVWAEVPGTRARSARRRIEIIRRPRIERLTLAIEPPAYTRRPRRTVPVSAGDVEILAGSRVVLHLEADRPLARAWARVERAGRPPEAVDLAVEGRRAEGPIPAERSATLRLRIRDPEGIEREAEVPLRLSVRPDAPPRISILSPPPETYAVPGARIRIRVAASDDLGLRDIVIGIEGGDLPATTHPRDGDCSATVERAIVLDGTAAGDELRIEAAASDLRPGGGGTSRADPARIRIVPPAELAERARTQLRLEDLVARYEGLRARLAALRDRAARELRDLSALRRPTARALEAWRRRQGRTGEAAAALARDLAGYAEGPAVYAFDEEARAALAGIARDLLDRSAPGPAASRGTIAGSHEALLARQAAIAAALASACDAFDRAIRVRLARLARIFAIVRSLEGFRRLHADARALARALGEPDADPLARAPAARAIARALRGLVAALREAAGEAASGFPRASKSAVAIADAMERAGIAAIFDGGARDLARGDLIAGRREVAEGIAAMEKLARPPGEGGAATRPGPLDQALALALGGEMEATKRALAGAVRSPLPEEIARALRPEAAGAARAGLFGPGGALGAQRPAEGPPAPPPVRIAAGAVEVIEGGEEMLGAEGAGARILLRYEREIAAYRRWLEGSR